MAGKPDQPVTKPGAWAVVRSQEPQIFLADGPEVISRVLALNLVAQMPADTVSSPVRLKEMRRALLEERWADALADWIEETGTPVDVYPESPRVWSDTDLDLEQASLEIKVAPLFAD
ncbi:MAG TPA: hypothetical protein VE174_05355 [Actinomycetota bacterium]|nr:hypothetical protein [Actinomycetota bacterium]